MKLAIGEPRLALLFIKKKKIPRRYFWCVSPFRTRRNVQSSVEKRCNKNIKIKKERAHK